eukprot:TRINITY_DN60_c0_g1_i2.p1 TRINITY_DN60_c0_g1~~TRINITY_DN60_c0_g1_i2.p1  ORF type:complete len:308 (+),score=22.93 TRINITY_DN60_c0_g1_i2:2076-2999(+)
MALKVDSRPEHEFFLPSDKEAALLDRLGMNTLQDLESLLVGIREETRGLPEVSATESPTSSVQKVQRRMLSQLATCLGLLVVKEVAVSTEYEYEGSKKGTYGAIDHVLVSGTLRVDDDYSFASASSRFRGKRHHYAPPFFTLLGWEAKSREGRAKYMQLVRREAKKKNKGRSASTPVKPSPVTTGTPGQARPSATLRLPDIVQGGFYGKGLKEANNSKFLERTKRMNSGDTEAQECLPMVISDSYNFVFQKRFLTYQEQSPQLNLDDHRPVIARVLLWALHQASELEKIYYPRPPTQNSPNFIVNSP